MISQDANNKLRPKTFLIKMSKKTYYVFEWCVDETYRFQFTKKYQKYFAVDPTGNRRRRRFGTGPTIIRAQWPKTGSIIQEGNIFYFFFF